MLAINSSAAFKATFASSCVFAKDFRVSIRQVRHDINHFVKDLEKEEGLPEDRVKKELDNVQKITDKFIQKINEMLEKKEQEILEV